MIEKLIGETMKILSFKYNPKEFGFEVECIMPGQNLPGIYRLDRKFFPNHTPVPLLDEHVQVGEQVHVWIKEEELLKREGWASADNKLLTSPDSPFKIGKAKKSFLGGAHKGTVCLDHEFKPFIAIKGYRFSASELKCVLRVETLFKGKDARIEASGGVWEYKAEVDKLYTPDGYGLSGDNLVTLIDLLRRARLV